MHSGGQLAGSDVPTLSTDRRRIRSVFKTQDVEVVKLSCWTREMMLNISEYYIYILYIITVILYDDIWCINISYVYFNKLYIKIIDNRIIHKPSPTQTRSTLNLQIYQELWISPRPDKLWCINDVRFLYFHRDYTSISWTLLLVTMISHISIRTFQAWPMSKSSLCQPHDSRTLGTSLEIVKSP